jgi:hypothetical protein
VQLLTGYALQQLCVLASAYCGATRTALCRMLSSRQCSLRPLLPPIACFLLTAAAAAADMSCSCTVETAAQCQALTHLSRE